MIDEITQGIDTFQKILNSIDDFTSEGFPYRDGARAKAELQIRETVRKLFGERSPEFQAHKAHKLKIATPAETTQSVVLIKSFVAALERKKLELQGLAAPAAAQDSGTSEPPLSRPQMTLVPPTAPSAQITMNQSAPGSTPPVTMSVAITTNLSQPLPAAGGAALATTQAPTPEPPAPAHPAVEVVPSGHLESARIRTMPAESQPTTPAPVSAHATINTAAPVTWQEPVAPRAVTPTIQSPAPPPIPVQAAPHSAPEESPMPIPRPAPTASVPPSLDQPMTRATSVAPSAPATTSTGDLASTTPVQADPLDALRKVCLRFHAVARQLRLRKDYRTTLEVEDDYDLQDLLCALLKLEFDEVGIDEWTPPYTGGSTRTTLLLHNDRIAVVAKKTRSGLTTKELAEQIAADASHYASRHPCTQLFCFIYDPEGRIGSPTRLESDLTSVSDRYTVHVLVAPK